MRACREGEALFAPGRIERSVETLDAIRTRRSIGRSEGDVDERTIRELIEAAVAAPNHHLTQPWRFTVVRGDARGRLGDLWAARYADETAPAARDAFIEGQRAKLLRAPVIVVVSTRTDVDPLRATEDRDATAAAVENFLLAAHARGLAAAWRTGRIAADIEVKRFLGLDPSDRIVAFVYLGAQASEAGDVRARSLDDVVRWID